MTIVDLRSDTVTKPTPAMREAMAAAEVGDDVFGEDPEVNALQRDVASMFGHEAALFAPSGSMANQIAVQTLVPPGEALVCDANAHIVVYEIGAASAIGGITTRTWSGEFGAIDLDAVARLVEPPGYSGAVPTRALAVENTHNRGGGAVIALKTLRAMRELADESGMALHCDGARIWHAHVAEGVPLAEYGRLFDTMSVCLSKGLGAPVGSVMIGSAERVERARLLRKRLGGGMRQAGVLAAAGRHALSHHIGRLADDHARARRLASALAPFGVVDMARVRTNMVFLDAGPFGMGAPELVARAAERGVRVVPMSPRVVRAVTHLDIDDDALDRAAEVLTNLARVHVR